MILNSRLIRISFSSSDVSPLFFASLSRTLNTVSVTNTFLCIFSIVLFICLCFAFHVLLTDAGIGTCLGVRYEQGCQGRLSDLVRVMGMTRKCIYQDRFCVDCFWFW